MSPRSSVREAERTRSAVVAGAIDLASTGGLEPLSIGRLATSLEMSKAGVVGPFGSKEALQLATIDEANAIFTREVWDPAEGEKPGLPRLRAICEAWVSYLERDVFPGGCFLTQAAAEFDGRPGPVRDSVSRALSLWDRVLTREAAIAVDRGELPPATDPAQVAFEIAAVAQGVNQARQARDDPEAAARGRRAMDRVLAR
jgi:AcrR family transcriptional regulator